MGDTSDTLGLGVKDPRFVGAIDMLRRTGAADFQIRFSDDEQPVVWIAVVRHRVKDGLPVSDGPVNSSMAAAGLTPLEAVLELCEKAIDGGTCAHCHRLTMFTAELSTTSLDDLIDLAVCQTMWDPELATYRRACEGNT